MDFGFIILLGLGVAAFVGIFLYQRLGRVPEAPDDKLDAERQDVRRAIDSMKKM